MEEERGKVPEKTARIVASGLAADRIATTVAPFRPDKAVQLNDFDGVQSDA